MFKMWVSVESMHSGHRHLTPADFADWLCWFVRHRTGSNMVAALYIDVNGPYPAMDNVECWPAVAEQYPGPYPVICHPPCGQWGKCRTITKYQSRKCGIDAIEMVHRWGGVVEQPSGSKLFAEHGRSGGKLLTVHQGLWGHRALKKTLLYYLFPVNGG